VLVDHDRAIEGLYTETLKLEIRHKVAQAMELSHDVRRRIPRSWHINKVGLNRPSITDWPGATAAIMVNDDFEATADQTSTSVTGAIQVDTN
jgi:hypothetical protein